MEMDLYASTGEGEAPETAPGGVAPRSVREWLERVEAIGGVKHITAEVDWNLEMSALTYMAHQAPGAPALCFEQIKGYGGEVRCLWNMLGSSFDRIALALGLPAGMKPLELIGAMRARMKRRLAPVYVDAADAPILEQQWSGADVDLLRYPIPRHWPLDGGRYAGTADAVITRDPDSGWLNVGTYRMMVHDKSHVGLYLSPGKDALLHIERAQAKGQPLEVMAVWGTPPATFMVASQSYPKTTSELEYIGGLNGEPLRLVAGKTTSLPLLADAEFVIEGVIHPGATRLEGPFGEFTGYYGRPEDYSPVVEVTAIYHRSRPILTNALMADYPACESGGVYAVARSAKIWDELDRLGVPGIKGVYCHPAAAAGAGMTTIAIEQRYAGHAAQVLALAAQSPGGAYFAKWIVVVDEDVDPTSLEQVIWAMTTRCSPVDDIDILRNTWSSYLDPTLNPPENRPWGSKALINACKQHRYLQQFSPRSRVDRATYEQVRRRWKELGMEGEPPTLLTLED